MPWGALKKEKLCPSIFTIFPIFYFFLEYLRVVGTRNTFNCSKSKNKHISITGNFYLFSMISFKYCNILAEVSHHQKLCPVTPKQCQEVTSPLSEKYLPLLLGPLELLMGWNAEVWQTPPPNTWTDRREGGNSGLDIAFDSKYTLIVQTLFLAMNSAFTKVVLPFRFLFLSLSIWKNLSCSTILHWVKEWDFEKKRVCSKEICEIADCIARIVFNGFYEHMTVTHTWAPEGKNNWWCFFA